jgi:hypothetical protein
MKEQNIILSLFCYLLLMLCSVIVAAVVWNSFANGVLYRCTDPFFDLWPPFVHTNSNDVYLVPKAMVLAIWGAFVGTAFALPGLVLWAIWRFGREDHDGTEEVAAKLNH